MTEAVAAAAPAEISTLPASALTRPFVVSVVPASLSSMVTLPAVATMDTSLPASTTPSTEIAPVSAVSFASLAFARTCAFPSTSIAP